MQDSDTIQKRNRLGTEVCLTLPSYDNINYWRPHSATWENATYWRKYWKDRTSRCGRDLSKYSTEKINNDFYSHVLKGDVIQWGYSTSEIKHSQLVQRTLRRADGKYTCHMIQHSSGRMEVDLYDYINNTGYTYACAYHFSGK